MIFETDESRRRIRADGAAYRKEYEGWIGGLGAAGKLVGGEALETEYIAPTTVRRAADGTSAVTEGPSQAGEGTGMVRPRLRLEGHAQALCVFVRSPS
ncbi:hypothetical protein AB0N28_03925 [Streptomyces sp. NPDC051130]|uniref:hypothetical protein n=1 Tax=Streptomyces sp. NPDC051130 TaxID=3157223 RepID=UPI00342C450E